MDRDQGHPHLACRLPDSPLLDNPHQVVARPRQLLHLREEKDVGNWSFDNIDVNHKKSIETIEQVNHLN